MDIGVSRAGKRPVRAAPLVVASARVVDRVVKPERELDVRGMLRQVGDLVEPGEALLEVLQRVIAAVRLAVARDQLRVQGNIRMLPARGEVQPYFTR
jgi:hypothetical protein